MIPAPSFAGARSAETSRWRGPGPCARLQERTLLQQMDTKELSEVADGFNEEFRRTVGVLARGQGILAMTRHRNVSHVAGARAANDPTAEHFANGPSPVTATMQLPFDALERGDTTRLIETLVSAGAAMRSGTARQLFSRMEETAKQNGMVVDARDRPFSVDLFIEGLEKMDIDFDAQGNAIMPEFVVHPSQMKKFCAALDTEEGKEKVAAVIAKKKAEKGL